MLVLIGAQNNHLQTAKGIRQVVAADGEELVSTGLFDVGTLSSKSSTLWYWCCGNCLTNLTGCVIDTSFMTSSLREEGSHVETFAGTIVSNICRPCLLV